MLTELGRSQACCPPSMTLISDRRIAAYHTAGPDQWVSMMAGHDSAATVEANKIVPYRNGD